MAEALLSAARDLVNAVNTALGQEQTVTSPSSTNAVNDGDVSFPLPMDSVPEESMNHVNL